MPGEITRDEAKNIAKAAVQVARDIKRIKPEIILVPLLGGYPVYKLAFEALRSVLKTPAEKYDPIVIFSFMRYDRFDFKSYDMPVKEQLKKVVRICGRQKNLMILDEVRCGASLEFIMKNNEKELREMANNIHASCIASNLKFDQDNIYLKDFSHVYLHRLPYKYVPFADKVKKMGLRRIEGRYKTKRETYWGALGYSVDEVYDIHVEPYKTLESKKFLKSVKKYILRNHY